MTLDFSFFMMPLYHTTVNSLIRFCVCFRRKTSLAGSMVGPCVFWASLASYVSSAYGCIGWFHHGSIWPNQPGRSKQPSFLCELDSVLFFFFFKKKNWHTFVWDWDMNRNHWFTNISEDLKKKITWLYLFKNSFICIINMWTLVSCELRKLLNI
jgi:hypothetical protein